jgi:predicted dienelactone hydrolase
VLLLNPGAARAIDVLQIRLPFLQEDFSVRIAELADPDGLWAGSSDLAELNRATNGAYALRLQELLHQPLPMQDHLDAPMARQVELILKRLIDVDGKEAKVLDFEPVQAGLRKLMAEGRQATLLSLLQAIPGHKVSIRLDRAAPIVRQINQNNARITELLKTLPRLPAAPSEALRRGPFAITTRVVNLPTAGGKESLEVTLVRPMGPPSLPAVVISHGLWDSPTSFLGWAQHLASHGAPVLLPRHPGSDISQQAQMLAGNEPPPDPREFLRRPRDVKAVLDALDNGQIPGAEAIPARGLTFIGHSWGGTTALQLAGARSLRATLWQACKNINNPERNLSWVLQCTFLPAATDASLADPRIVRVVAVSPPQALVFAAGLVDLQKPVLLISGSSDMVVPAQPEALDPFHLYPMDRSQLVLVEGGTHFNLPAPASSDGGPLRALLLRWVQGTGLKADSAVADPAGRALLLVPHKGAVPANR